MKIGEPYGLSLTGMVARLKFASAVRAEDKCVSNDSEDLSDQHRQLLCLH